MVEPRDCYMLRCDINGVPYCVALKTLDDCNINCPFRKTREQQLAIEDHLALKIRQEDRALVRDFRSCVTGETYICV